MKKAGAEQEKIIKGGQIKKITLKGVKISREGLKIFFLAGAGAGAPTSPPASATGKRMYFRLINGLNPRPLAVMRYWYLTVNST
jgi:hypothetical protein